MGKQTLWVNRLDDNRTGEINNDLTSTPPTAQGQYGLSVVLLSLCFCPEANDFTGTVKYECAVRTAAEVARAVGMAVTVPGFCTLGQSKGFDFALQAVFW